MQRPVCVIACALVLASTAAADLVQPLAVTNGRCECVLATGHADDQYLLVLGSLARTKGPYHVSIVTEPTTAPIAKPLDNSIVDPGWREHIKQVAERLATARRQHFADEFVMPPMAPPRQKTFYLFVKDDNFQNPSSYIAVNAELRGIGKRCQVYVDRDHDDMKGLQATVDDVIRTFDGEVLPRALGAALDVDRDGRFTVLFSGWLAKMQNGQVKLSGFVRGSDLCREVAPPYGNQCDMMYLNTDLKPGPYLHTLIAHEYTHAVVFSEHYFGNYLPGVPRQDEQSWLNEAIAHLIEDSHGYSWGNLEYRISAFLNAPSRYSLVVPDYYGAKLWRDPGTRGATYLFLRWCVDRYGPELLTRLVQSNLNGVENLEAATQTPFVELFRQWSIALALSGTGLDMEDVPPLSGVNLHEKLGSRLLCGPRFDTLKLAGGHQSIDLAPTSVGHVLLHSPASARSKVIISCEKEAQLQVSLIKLPPRLPRLELKCEAAKQGAITLVMTSHNSAVTLEEAVWERVVTDEDPSRDTSFVSARLPGDSVKSWFGDNRLLNAGETRRSSDVQIPPGEVAVRVSGRDAAGHRVSAWTTAGSAAIDPGIPALLPH